MKISNKIIIFTIFFKSTISMNFSNSDIDSDVPSIYSEENILTNLWAAIKDNNVDWVAKNIDFCKNLITQINNEGHNPIELTIIYNRFEILQLFVQSNLESVITLKNKNNKTALDFARNSRKNEFINYLNQIIENHKMAVIKVESIKKYGNYHPGGRLKKNK